MKRSDLPPVPFTVSGAVDAHPARRIERLVADVGVRRAGMRKLAVFVTAALSGAVVGLGWLLAMVALADPELGAMAARALAGLALAGAVTVALLAGGELFAANLLLPMAWASGFITAQAWIRHQVVVVIGNLVGVCVAVWSAEAAGLVAAVNGLPEALAADAAALRALPFWPGFWQGAIGAFLVASGVWLGYASNTLTDRILALLLPVTILGALGAEHVALAMAGLAADLAPRPWEAVWAVAAGNLAVGGAGVAVVYWAVYLRGRGAASGPGSEG